MRKSVTLILCLTMLGVILFAGTSYAAPDSSKPSIVASFYPVYEFTKQVVGDKAKVALLVPAGAEPHDWEPGPADIIKIKKAPLLICNGAGMEHWLDKMQSSFAGKKIVKASDYVTLLPAQYNEEGEAAPAGSVDPHLWIDPVNAQAVVAGIAAEVAKIDPENAGFYQENARNYIAQLQSLHEEYVQSLSGFNKTQIVTSHAAFGYLAKRYGLQQVAIMGLTPDAEPTPERMVKVVKFVRANGIKYIFFETLVSPKLSEVIASETGAQTLVLNPIEGLSDEEIAQGANYITVMKMNLVNLKRALTD